MTTQEKMKMVESLVNGKIDSVERDKAWTIVNRGADPEMVAMMINAGTLVETGFDLIDI